MDRLIAALDCILSNRGGSVSAKPQILFEVFLRRKPCWIGVFDIFSVWNILRRKSIGFKHNNSVNSLARTILGWNISCVSKFNVLLRIWDSAWRTDRTSVGLAPKEALSPALLIIF